jgi:hypothetical protein
MRRLAHLADGRGTLDSGRGCAYRWPPIRQREPVRRRGDGKGNPMSDRPNDRAHPGFSFQDLSQFMVGCMERAWEVAPDLPEAAADPKQLMDDWQTLCRAWMMGPAGIPLLLTPRNRDLMARMLYVYGFLDDPKDTEGVKAITKDFLRAWLELADGARGRGGEMWEIHQRLMRRFGEAMEKTAADFAGGKP